jgi:ACS family sodium-dependent inorganic phosphate cotransporter
VLFVPVWLSLPAEPFREGGGVEGRGEGGSGGERRRGEVWKRRWGEEAVEEVGSLVKRREVQAIIVAQYTQSWGLYGIMNWLPSYIEQQFQVPVGDLDQFTVLPYLLQGGVGMMAGICADSAIQRGLPVRRCRQLFQGVGMLVPSLSLFASATLAHSAEDARAYLSVALAASSLTLAGVSVNHLDVAPSKAGLVFGIGNTAGTLGGFVSVALCGYLQDTDSEKFSLQFLDRINVPGH